MADLSARTAPGKQVLICLPFAGAHMDPFRALSAALAPVGGVDVVSHSYPGHGPRIRDGLLPTIEAMADDCIATVVDARPSSTTVSLLGYSMGALVAVEVARRLGATGRQVDRVVVMAATPPHRLDPAPLDVATDDALLAHCEQYGLIAPGAFSSEALRELFLPALRNDILAVAAFARSTGGVRMLPATARLSAFSGAADPSVRDTADWADLSTGHVERHVHPGGHFFIRDDEQAVVDAVVRLFDASHGRGAEAARPVSTGLDLITKEPVDADR